MHCFWLAHFPRKGAFAVALALCSIPLALAQPSSGVSWGSDGGGWATAASIGAGAAAGAMLSTQALPRETLADAQKLPTSLPSPQSSIWIESPLPVSAQELREQNAIGEKIRESGPWTASWVILSAPLDAQENPAAAWAKLRSALSAKSAGSASDAYSAVSPEPLAVARGRAFLALNGRSQVQQVSAGSAMGLNEDSVPVGSHASFGPPGQAANRTANGEVRAVFDRRDRAALSWSMSVDDGVRFQSEGTVAVNPGQTVWVAHFSRGVLWVMGVEAKRPKAGQD